MSAQSIAQSHSRMGARIASPSNFQPRACVSQLATDTHTGTEVALKRVNEEPVLLRHHQHHGYAPRKDHRAHALQEWRVAVLLADHLSEPGAEFLSLPTECFGGNGSRGGNGSVILLYSEQLETFSWTQKRTRYVRLPRASIHVYVHAWNFVQCACAPCPASMHASQTVRSVITLATKTVPCVLARSLQLDTHASSAEWWQVVRAVLAGLALMARHGVFQADMTHENINSKGQRMTSVSNLMTTKLGVTKIIGRWFVCTKRSGGLRTLPTDTSTRALSHANLTPQILVRPALQMGHLAPLMSRTRVRASGCAWRTRACRVQSWAAAGCGRPTTRARWGVKKVIYMVAAAVIVERSLAL